MKIMEKVKNRYQYDGGLWTVRFRNRVAIDSNLFKAIWKFIFEPNHK